MSNNKQTPEFKFTGFDSDGTIHLNGGLILISPKNIGREAAKTICDFILSTPATAAERDELRAENEELKLKTKRQEDEWVLNGSIQEWKDYAEEWEDYAERTTNKISRLESLNAELLRGLENIASENYDDDDKSRHLRAIIDRMKDAAHKAISKSKAN